MGSKLLWFLVFSLSMEGEKIQRSSIGPALTEARREIQQLEGSLHRQSSELERARKKIEQLEQENAKLREELKMLQGAPSWVKPNLSEAVRRRAKKRGPKFGHAAHPRRVPEQIDREVKLVPKRCPHCGANDLPSPHKWHRHVQIDLPPPQRPIVTRYHVGWCWCRHCGTAVSSGVKLSRSLYGPQLHAQACYWKHGLGLTLPKIQTLLHDQYDLEISTGQLAELLKRSAGCLNAMHEEVKTSLLDQPVLYVDETGWRTDGDNRWLWSFSSNDYSYYTIEASRGSQVVEDVVGACYRGVLVSDFYNAYHKLDSTKQKCWAHVLRKLAELREKIPKEVEIQYFQSRLKGFFDWSCRLQRGHQAHKDIRSSTRRLRTTTERFLCRRHRHPELKKLAKRLVKHREELYTFITTGVEPTNNRAEREIRPAVLMRKTSYGNRSEQGAKDQAVLMSIIRTCAKQKISFVPYVVDHLTHHWNLGE